jgi:AraC-like DNA-binding protein
MICKSISPSPALKEFVRNYTLLHLRFNNAQQIPFKHRPPKPEQGIVFYIKGYVNLANLVTGDQQTPATVALFSHQTDKKLFQVSAEFFMFTIFLRPGILHRLTGVPAVDLKQDYHDAELFFGTEVRAITEQLSSATGYSSMVDIIERFLLPKFRQMKTQAAVDEVADYLLADPTRFSLDYAASQACLSTKQFYRRFVERIGISPKLFSRMSRFNYAYHYKIAQPNASWSSVAQEFYYTDYHHMEKECKEFTGLTPNEWLQQNQASPERILRLR